ncbi:SDR family oxidoreductase [Amycolatopsis roodepoortensis]|uniref:NAD(P)-dependent dehydrogenase (Short-subunit alcohol dehydrogenase family) n=1 Tax=Amycolatopsis roodepoortensis TaxID=700274 RepID=A0ABR9L338_9PSEU|nr:SDR family oxidoreductase [Amycolatopsis roodepoortensis]MBE1575163.1 NAD(P)-dependent dehydrogenase (short-subunit alcohol dehydrogenase family) [Amycolatopsis roodepoortensis]
MTTYFVTGATGFLGKRLVARLLRRPETVAVHVLVRETSRGKLPSHEKLVPVTGDLTEPLLGVDPACLEPLDHVVHLGAIYDLTADEAANRAANVDGTRNVLEFAAAAKAGLFHHVSSIAVAGQYAGRFTEADFDLGQSFASPYHATKFEAEKLVRQHGKTPFRVYRPSAVAGDSRTGEMDKIDGPYYFLPAISRLAALPRRLPLAAPDLGATNLVPVDYVVEAMEHLIHADAPSGSTYHLASPRPQPLHEVYNAFARAAGGPKISAVLPPGPSGALKRAETRLAKSAAAGFDRVPGGRPARAAVLAELGIPLEVLPHLSMEVDFDTSVTTAALEGSGITLPPLKEYAGPLYRYWLEHLDPDRGRRRPGPEPLDGRKVLITGASSGIGRASALAVAAKGAEVILVARRADELEQVREQIVAAGGKASAYPCDLTDGGAVDALVKDVLAAHGAVDMLVNNAGRSIRRSLSLSTERFHDYERTMAINYFGPVRLTLGLLPSMTARGFGHVVNVTTQGLQTDTPRFSAYLASKAALEEFGLTAGRETLSDGVTFTSVRMPLVRTDMIAPTGSYRGMPSSSPERAAALVVKALEKRPEILNLPEGTAAELVTLVAPKTARFFAHLVYRAMPESAPESRGLPRKAPLASVAGAVTRLVWRRRP